MEYGYKLYNDIIGVTIQVEYGYKLYNDIIGVMIKLNHSEGKYR